MIFGVPVLAEASEFALRRFANVVDVLYDVDARLTIYADAYIEEVAGSLRDVPGLARLYSRLSLLARTAMDSVNGDGQRQLRSSVNSR